MIKTIKFVLSLEEPEVDVIGFCSAERFCIIIFRAFIYSFLMPSGNKEGLLIFIFAVMFCTFNGYMQSKYLIKAKYPDDWIYGWKCILGIVILLKSVYSQ